MHRTGMEIGPEAAGPVPADRGHPRPATRRATRLRWPESSDCGRRAACGGTRGLATRGSVPRPTGVRRLSGPAHRCRRDGHLSHLRGDGRSHAGTQPRHHRLLRCRIHRRVSGPAVPNRRRAADPRHQPAECGPRDGGFGLQSLRLGPSGRHVGWSFPICPAPNRCCRTKSTWY